MKLIPLDALVAEINQRIEDYKSHKIEDSYHDGLIFALKDLRDDFIDTLKVKEVDLEKELDSLITPELKKHKALPSLMETAKHFFNLGLQSTLTEEDMRLVWTIGDDIPPMAEEDFFKELLKRYNAKKGE